MLHLLWIIQVLPLLIFLRLTMLASNIKSSAPMISILGSLLNFVAAMTLLTFYAKHGSGNEIILFESTWLSTSAMETLPLFGAKANLIKDISVGFLIDPLNIMMLIIVTLISLLVQIFSASYMSHDSDKPRYFAFLSFFTFTMIGLVLSSNLLQTFMFWELVGLASYLLIGFWFEKKSAADAARKAFVLNRLADLGFIAGLALLFFAYGSLQISDLFHIQSSPTMPLWMMTLSGLLILMGVMGKSAQFPFHVWLPDAMEGPTPVSALIHSATMVAAGVFLLARTFNLFAVSSITMTTVLVIGTITSLIAALLAINQTDIKKVLAYSTISQLGLMVMAIGCGSVVFGLFHLTTHAFFKSMLFLTAGAFIHLYGTNDLYKIGKSGAKKQTMLMIIFFIGLASLSGIPPFSGFFSKDAILHELMITHFVMGICGLIITFLTAYYSFRMFFILFLAETKPQEIHSEPFWLKLCTYGPLWFLAISSIIVGLMGTPILHDVILLWINSHAHSIKYELVQLLITLTIIFGGIVFAYRQIKFPSKAKKSENLFWTALKNKFWMDAFYEVLLKKLAMPLGNLLFKFDRTVPNKWLVDDTSHMVKKFGEFFSKIQNGQLQNYLFLMLTACFFVIYYFSQIGSH